ncbi:MAG: M28 family peptidase [Gemmatimonadales bacterium]|nr:M28 family peptidase [Gemmatimonadales bacterium]
MSLVSGFALLSALLVVTPAHLRAQFGTQQQPVRIPQPPPIRPIDDIRYLSDDRLGGRMTGSPGADTAAAYLARRFEQVGLQPAAGGWFQSFTVAKEAPVAQHAHVGGLQAKNVIGILPGRDPVLRNEAVIIGAHYDHLGLGGFGSLDPDSTGEVHNGADDNASGAAMLIQIARRMAGTRPARTLVFIAFSGEELGLLGSSHYVKAPIYPLAATLAMLNLDMVGRLRDKRLIVYGTRTAKEFPALLDSLNWYAGFDLKRQGDGYGPSDHSSFYAAGRPVLHLFTDLHEDYHRTTDDWNKIDQDGFEQVSDFTTGIVTALANRPTRLTPVNLSEPSSTGPAAGHHADSAAAAVTPGYGAYLGTIPDMSDSPGGVRLLGVRTGSPAEKAGLRGDDVITRIGPMQVPDLQAMTDALRSHKSGDTVDIVFKRGDRVTTVRATLGTRGG